MMGSRAGIGRTAADRRSRRGRDRRAASPPVALRPRGARRPPRARAAAPTASIAVHSTALGPALGGLRIWHYPAATTGSRDALRLAAGMTYKAAAAGLDLGGGKGVICAPAGAAREASAGAARAARLRRPGRVARRPLHHRRGRRHRARRHGRDRRAHQPRHRPAARARRHRRPEPVHGDRASRPRSAPASARASATRTSPGAGRAWSASATSARGSRGGWRRRAAS